MRVSTQLIPGGRPGTVKTLQEMERLVEAGKRNPAVRSQMIREALRGVPERNTMGEVRAVIDWVRRRVRYTRDPHELELIQGADHTLNVGHGDCDDFVILSRSALESIGYKTRSKVTGRHPDHYQHVLIEVYDPKARRWVAVDPIAKDKPFGWSPVSGASEVYPTMADHTAIMTGYPLRYRHRKPHARLIAMGINPLWLDQRAEAALLVHEMHNRPGNYGPHAGAKGLSLQSKYSDFRWSGLGGFATLGDDGSIVSSVASSGMTPSGSGCLFSGGLGGLGGQTHAINVGFHFRILEIMNKYGGGAVLRGSTKRTPDGKPWKHDPVPGGMCGPFRCYDCPMMAQHPWVAQEQGDVAFDHVKNYIWYKHVTTVPAGLPLWDETGGVGQYFCWLVALDVLPEDIPGLPPGYIKEAKEAAFTFVGARVHRIKRRIKKAKKRARVTKYVAIGVGTLAAIVTGGLAASGLAALGASKAIVAGAGGLLAKGSAFAIGTIGGAGLTKSVANDLEKAGILSVQAESAGQLIANVEQVASDEPGATTGTPALDLVIRELQAKYDAALKKAITAPAALAPSSPWAQPTVGPQAFAPVYPVTPASMDQGTAAKGFQTGTVVAIGAAALALVVSGILLMRK